MGRAFEMFRVTSEHNISPIGAIWIEFMKVLVFKLIKVASGMLYLLPKIERPSLHYS